ncbi:hypothetical protein RJ639_046819 [Escallonia herrerae]|uniref:NAC domain-containing protein n=1 Tax=Escallonia herrerae TaxID=1293975 RepID=A0AA88W5E4_9ASTE|nr:hypothetical protein RJ639_046819 [Escallonia herrerae]
MVTCSTSSSHAEEKEKEGEKNLPITSSVHGGRLSGEQKYPSGYHFVPTDFELIRYLLTKIVGQELPPNTIEHNAYLYERDPEKLPAISLSFEGGYWKAWGQDVKIFDSNQNIVGFRKTLVFYRGEGPEGEQTPWLLHEYRVDPNTITAWLLHNYRADPNIVTADHAVNDRVSIEIERCVVCKIRKLGRGQICN